MVMRRATMPAPLAESLVWQATTLQERMFHWFRNFWAFSCPGKRARRAASPHTHTYLPLEGYIEGWLPVNFG